MPIYQHLSQFAGYPVAEFHVEKESFPFATHAPRLRLDYEQHESGTTFTDVFAAFVNAPGADRTRALVIGPWGYESEDSTTVVEALASFRDRLPALRALFIGEIVCEENEISWINQSDLAAVWPSYPKLEHIQIRGSQGLSLGRIASPALKTLIVESGGLPRQVIGEALAADAPDLEHLELWLGSEDYGADSSPADFARLFAGELFPRLKTLALRDCEYADDLARAIAEAPILERIETLDLSLGVLSDDGAEALLASPLTARLKKLDLHYHYLSDGMMERLRHALGVKVDLSDQQEKDDYGRFVAVSE